MLQFWALMLGYAQGGNTKPTKSNGVNILASSFGTVRLTRAVLSNLFHSVLGAFGGTPAVKGI